MFGFTYTQNKKFDFQTKDAIAELYLDLPKTYIYFAKKIKQINQHYKFSDIIYAFRTLFSLDSFGINLTCTVLSVIVGICYIFNKFYNT